MIESADLVVILLLFGIFMTLAGMLGFIAGGFRREAEHMGQVLDRYLDDPKDEPVEDDWYEETPEQPALPVDLDNPPVTRRYNPRSGSVQKHCSCHDRPLEIGEDVLWWPTPDGGVRIICKDGLSGATD